MKKLIGLTFAAMLIVVGLSANSSAQTRHRRYPHNLERREDRQQDRINQGIGSGSLNRRETYHLEKQQARIDRTEDRFRSSGGKLTNRERGILERRYNRASRNIYHQKHDAQRYGTTRRRL